MRAVLALLERADIEPVAIAAAMLQGGKWRAALARWQDRIVAPLVSPRLSRTESGRWIPEQVG
jgi:adenine/guanine phosphoribosyltransferase-like PRPP-binding protein